MKPHRLAPGAAFLLALLTAAAQQPQQPAQPAPDNAKPPEKCSIEGNAVNLVTGEPVKKAQISLRSLSGGVGASTSTDASGHFAMKDIDAGRYNLFVMRTGYVQQQYGAHAPGRSGALITLVPGQKLGDLNFRLTPHSVITGKITDEDGDPVANVGVQIMRYRFQDGKKILFPAGGSQTNDLGEYRIFGVAPGRHFLSAIYRRYMFPDTVDRTAASARAPAQPEENYVTTYYPGTSEPLAAVQVDVPMGSQARGLDFTLQKVRTVRIQGRLVNTVAKARNNMVRVYVLPRDSRMFAFMMNGPSTIVHGGQGPFEIHGVAPGSYYISADIFTEENGRYSAHMPLEVGKETIEGVNLVLAAANDLTGHIRLEGTGDVNFTDLHVTLQSRDVAFMMGSSDGRVKDDGSFTIQNVGPEDYTIRVFGFPENFYVKSIRMGTEDVLDSNISLARSGPAALDVVISPNGGQVEGVVTDSKDQPSTGATVALVPEPSRREQSTRYKNIATDQNGHFKFSGISPGEYQLFAWEDVEPGAYMDPDFLKSVEKHGEAISIKENSHEVKALKVIPADESARAAN